MAHHSINSSVFNLQRTEEISLTTERQEDVERHDGCHDRYGNPALVVTDGGPEGQDQDRTRETESHNDGKPPNGLVRDDPQHHSGYVDGQGVSVDTDDLQEGVRNYVHNLGVPPDKQAPQGQGNQPRIAVDRRRRNGHFLELWDVFILGFPQVNQEVRDVSTDGDDKNQSSTDPEGTIKIRVVADVEMDKILPWPWQ